MSERTFFQNPDFVKYVQLLTELHAMIRSGADESPEGEALRERMDAPGSRLSPEEVQAVTEISALFYALDPLPVASGD